MMPSRDFLVRQAVLNAMVEMWPSAVASRGVARAIQFVGYDRTHPDVFKHLELPQAVRREFHALTQRYSEAA